MEMLLELDDAEKKVEQARDSIMSEITRFIPDSGSSFAAEHDLNRGNLYLLLKQGRWNRHLVSDVLSALDKSAPEEPPYPKRPRGKRPKLDP